MKLSFEIQDASENFSEENLLIQLGERELIYLIYDTENRCKALGAYEISESDQTISLGSDVKELFLKHPLFSRVFKKIILIYHLRPSLLVPLSFTDGLQVQEMFRLVHGDVSKFRILSDTVMGMDAVNYYAVPHAWLKELSEVFVGDLVRHRNSLLPAVVKPSGDHFFCVFGLGSFTVMVFVNGEFQFIQTFSFSNPEDVVYQLLHIAQNNQVDPSSVVVQVSGYIDSQSALHAALEKYFMTIETLSLPTRFVYPSEMEKYPAHYFSHLFLLAACV